MSFDISERLSQLRELKEFISSAETKLLTVVERLGWDLDDRWTPEFVCCPVNKGHRVHKDKLENHINVCKWRSEGYQDTDIALPDANSGDSTMSGTTFAIDNALVNTIITDAVSVNPQMKTDNMEVIALVDSNKWLKISFLSVDHPLPQTQDRIVSEYTTDERKVIYDYVISKSEMKNVSLEDLNFPFRNEKKDEPKSYLELLAAERDAKRRRISYRQKKVSTNRKSHTEVMREVIQNQMDLFNEWLNKDVQKDESNVNEESTSVTSVRSAGDDRQRVHEQELGHHGNSPTRNQMQDSFSESHKKMDQHKGFGSQRRNSSLSAGNTSNRNSRYDSSYNKDRYESMKRRGDHNRDHLDDYRSRSDDRHRSRRDDRQRDESRRGEKEARYVDRTRKTDGERSKGRDSRDEDRTRERGSRVQSRTNRMDKRDDNEGRSRTFSIDKDIEASGYDPNRTIKSEKLDEYEVAENAQTVLNFEPSFSNASDRSHNVEKSGENGSSLLALKDIKNEWSDDSEEPSSSHKHDKHKKKKKKKRKHKKKHKKKSKQQSSSDENSSSDFSC